MLKLLVKKQLTEIFRAYLYDAKKNRARSKAATVGYLVFFVFIMVGIIGGMFTLLSLAMCRSMAEAGMSWFYFAIMGLMAILLGAFGSVFTTYSSLYLPKDNDQMLSLPIPVNTLIAARLLGVYLMGLMYSGVVVLPAIIVYWATVSAAPLHLLAGVLFLLLISLFVMAISCLLGWVVAKVSLKLKNKSFVTVVLSLVFFGLYYYFFSFKANSLLTELLQNIALYGDKVRSSAYPVYLFGQAGAGDPLSMLLLTAAIAVLFGLTWLLLSRSFLSIATASGHVGRKVYRAKAVRCRSISSALLDRELRRFTSSANYMLNCGFGTIFLVLASGFLLWQGRELLELDTDTCIISTPYDAYRAVHLICHSLPIERICKSHDLVSFHLDDYIDDVRNTVLESRFRAYPILDENEHVVGTLSRFHLLRPRRKRVILVDHNEKAQSVPGLDQADILEIVDHHRLADIETNNPIYVRNEPVGSSTTIVADMYQEKGLKPSAKMAGLMAAAIVSDTVMFKSPTCTQRDIDIANRMSRIANVSLEELGQTIFSAATGEDKSAESIIRTDYKEFHIGGHNLAVSQITCLDSDRLMARKEEFLATMETIRKKNGLDIVLLMITNVLVEGSYLLYSGDTETIRQAFNITGEEKNCVFLSKIMSRKKQIIPSLSALWG